MRRIFVDESPGDAGEFILQDEPFHHAAQVLRLKQGDEFQVLCGDGKLRSARVLGVEKKRLHAEVTSVTDLPLLPRPRVSLAVALPRWPTFETVVEKAVELGVYRIQPLFSDFSFSKSPKEVPAAKFERSMRIVKAATEQTCRGDLMAVLPPRSLDEWLKEMAAANPNGPLPCLFPCEPAAATDRLDVQSQARKLRDLPVEEIWGLIGSEGGFSPREVKLLSDVGVLPASFAPQILRVDTACVVTASVLKYEFGQMG